MGVLCMLGFHIWEYITTADNRFRGCQRCGKWQRMSESDQYWKNPGAYDKINWNKMRARIYEEWEADG